jgi:thymidylate synthase
MSNWEKAQYAQLIDKILNHGEKRESRAGPVYSLFGEVIDIDMSVDFPLLQGRKMFYEGVLGELAAMFRGPKNVADFKEHGCNYWDAWGMKEGDEIRICDNVTETVEAGHLELDYGNSWIDFNGVNQLENLVNTLKSNPLDRRMLVTGWRPDRLDKLSLPCCHMLYQWYVREGKFLDMVWYQRSVDTMVGLPSDIVLCAAWNAVIAKQTGFAPGRIRLVLGDTHIYQNHLDGVMDYMRALQKTEIMPIPYNLNDETTYKTFVPSHLTIAAYTPKPAIKFKLNV